MTLDNLMLKYQYDMKIIEKKYKKMRENDRDDLDYADISE